MEAPEPKIDVISQPEIPLSARFAPELAGPEGPPELGSNLGTIVDPGPSTSTKGAKVASYRLHAEDITAPFSGREGVSKAKLLRREGGTVHSEKAVENGVDWIIRHQRPDGSWSLSYQTQCQGPGCSGQASLESDTAATGLALLPLLGAGHIHTQKSRYQLNVRKGLEWLVDHQDASGDLFVGGAPMAYLYSHAIATMALCEAYGISGDQTLRRPAERALRFIVQAQNAETGGWRYNPGQAGDTSVFGWNIFAIRSARLAGIAVPKNVFRGCKFYLDSVASDSSKVLYSYLPGRPVTAPMTAEALLSRQYMGWPRDYPPLIKGARHIAIDLEQSEERNIYYWYYATQLLHNMQNQDWKRWNAARARRSGRHAGQGQRLRPRELGPGLAPARSLVPFGRATLPDLALDAYPGSLLPLPAALSAQRHRPAPRQGGRRRRRAPPGRQPAQGRPAAGPGAARTMNRALVGPNALPALPAQGTNWATRIDL